VKGKSRIPSIFDLFFQPSLIIVATFENQNAYQQLSRNELKNNGTGLDKIFKYDKVFKQK